jgi:acyl carrier protein
MDEHARDLSVQTQLLGLLEELAGDWEYDDEITAETRFVADLELESLDLVVLGEMIQETYGRLPFAEYLQEIGERPVELRDVTVAELATFICAHAKVTATGSDR